MFSEESSVGMCEEMGFNRSPNCLRLTKAERRCVGSEFQTAADVTQIRI